MFVGGKIDFSVIVSILIRFTTMLWVKLTRLNTQGLHSFNFYSELFITRTNEELTTIDLIRYSNKKYDNVFAMKHPPLLP